MKVPEGARTCTHQVRVGYIDTDRGDVMHHASYLRYLEQARVEYMREVGLDYRKLELDDRFGLPVVDAHVRYRKSAYFDDPLALTTWIGGLNRAKIRFDSLIHRGQELVATAEITLCCVKLPEAKLVSMPKQVLALRDS